MYDCAACGAQYKRSWRDGKFYPRQTKPEQTVGLKSLGEDWEDSDFRSPLRRVHSSRNTW